MQRTTSHPPQPTQPSVALNIWFPKRRIFDARYLTVPVWIGAAMWSVVLIGSGVVLLAACNGSGPALFGAALLLGPGLSLVLAVGRKIAAPDKKMSEDTGRLVAAAHFPIAMVAGTFVVGAICVAIFS